MTRLATVLLLGTTLFACGGGGGDSDCEKAAKKACAKACACPNPDGMCRIGDSVFTFEFADETACLALYLDQGCTMQNPGIDFAACNTALDTAMCVPDSSGPGNMRLDQPGECEVGGGPPPDGALR